MEGEKAAAVEVEVEGVEVAMEAVEAVVKLMQVASATQGTVSQAAVSWAQEAVVLPCRGQ